MDPAIRQRYHPGILEETLDRYAIDEKDIQLLDGFESFIYEFRRPQGDFILRIGHSLRRSEMMVLGEIDWIQYLAAGGAGVAKAVRSNQGRLVEFIEDGQGGKFVATAFHKAAGGPPTKKMWNQRLFQSWGRLLGRMHALTKSYQPKDPDWRREEWDSPGNMKVESWLPADEVAVLEKFKTLMNHFSALSKDRESYGLIHQDAHAGNFFVDSDYEVTLFDFDDCVYGWFIYDIAMVFFYGLIGHETDPEHIEFFVRNILKGYREENFLAPEWLEEIPYFLKLREIDLYAQIPFSYGGTENIDHPWCLKYMKGRKEKIERGQAYIDFDWGIFRSLLSRHSLRNKP
jgi:Ser/Thr protein kinase RdoA (MazF antagonist)